MLLIRIQLCIDKMGQVIFIVVRERGHGARVFPIAAADCRGAGKRAVVASAFAQPVEPFRAVGLRARPFADDGPFVGAGELWAQGAGGGDMVAGAHGDLGRGEDLILVRVEDDI